MKGPNVCWSLGLMVLWSLLSIGSARAQQPTVILVVGAPGEAEFIPDFTQQIDAWEKVSAQAKAKYLAIGDSLLRSQEPGAPIDEATPLDSPTDFDRLKQVLEAEPKEGRDELWLVLVGHGTFDGREAKFNLRGPDVSASELAGWLAPFRRPMAVINTSSGSAPFLAKLSGPDRVIVTATRSGYELNYARFGKFLAEALPDPKSDLDKDGQISLLEAFLSASHRTMEFYKTEGRLATEHALIDDNGDGLGTPADWFRGVRAVKKPRDDAAADGPRAHQFHLVRSAAEQQLPAEVRARRDKLELQLAELREAKAKLAEDAYFRELEKILLALAELYDET